MIEPKQIYHHKKYNLKLQVLTQSLIHKDHWHVGVMVNDEIIMSCHIYYKDIEEEKWELQSMEPK